MARWTIGKRARAEATWRAHFLAWRRSDLNQREYCEAYGLSLKAFGYWRTELRHEELAPQKLLWRRGGGLRHMTKTMTSAVTKTTRTRRNFSSAEKRQLVQEASQPGSSVSMVARRHGLAARVLFRWKHEAAAAATFVAVRLAEADR